MGRKALRMLGTLAAILAIVAGLDFTVTAVCGETCDGLGRIAQKKRVRIKHPVFHHGLAPMADTFDRWGDSYYRLRTNDLGLIDAAPRVVPKDPRRPRLLVLGDSFTEGVGLEWPETFAGRLSGALDARGWAMLNGGVSSYSPSIFDAKTRWLLSEGYRVDAVLAMIDVSDVFDEATRYRVTDDGAVVDRAAVAEKRRLTAWFEDRFLTARLVLAARDYLSYFGRYAVYALKGRAERRDPASREARLAVAFDVEAAKWSVDPAFMVRHGKPGLPLATKAMDRLADMLAARGIPLVVAVYPWPVHIHERAHDTPYRVHWRDWAAARGVPLLDLFALFVNDEDPATVIERDYIPFDFHWNANGHEKAARALLRGLEAAVVTAQTVEPGVGVKPEVVGIDAQ